MKYVSIMTSISSQDNLDATYALMVKGKERKKYNDGKNA